MFESNFYMDAVSKLNRHWAQAITDFYRNPYDLRQIKNREQEVVNV